MDKDGYVVANADDIRVNYIVSVNGKLAGVGNGNPTDVSIFQQTKKKMFHDKGLATIRPKC